MSLKHTVLVYKAYILRNEYYCIPLHNPHKE